MKTWIFHAANTIIIQQTPAVKADSLRNPQQNHLIESQIILAMRMVGTFYTGHSITLFEIHCLLFTVHTM